MKWYCCAKWENNKWYLMRAASPSVALIANTKHRHKPTYLHIWRHTLPAKTLLWINCEVASQVRCYGVQTSSDFAHQKYLLTLQTLQLTSNELRVSSLEQLCGCKQPTSVLYCMPELVASSKKFMLYFPAKQWKCSLVSSLEGVPNWSDSELFNMKCNFIAKQGLLKLPETAGITLQS